ncbi:MAG: hypothetical protein ACT443_09785, partial [Gemmatimonadota bacterium]
MEAGLAVVKRKPDARAKLQQLDSLLLATPAAGDVAVFGPIALARLHLAVGEPERALAAIRRRPYLSDGWPRYLATALREEAQLVKRVSDND